MAIRENIIALRDLFDITQEELATIAGVTRGAVSQWEGGFSEPRMGAIQRIADHFGIYKSNIIEDDGMKLIDPITKKPINQIAPPNARPVHGVKTSPIPLRSRVHAGPATDPDDLGATDRTVDVPESLLAADPDSYACEVEGDCMNRVYPEGCVVVVSPNRPPQNGSVAVVDIEGLGTVMRRMYRTPRTLVLSPDSFNDSHEDIVVTADDDRAVTFGGRVVWFQPLEEMK